MTKPIPRIETFMTAAPRSIGRDQLLATAHIAMHEHHIRHLPVLDGGALVGMLTERDVALAMGMRGIDPSSTRVEEVMTSSVYKVRPETPLDEVVHEMAEHRYGSAVVVADAKVVGVFTTVDACRALAELLRGRLAS